MNNVRVCDRGENKKQEEEKEKSTPPHGLCFVLMFF